MGLHGCPSRGCNNLPNQLWRTQCGGQALSLRAEGGPGIRADGAAVSTGQKEGQGWVRARSQDHWGIQARGGVGGRGRVQSYPKSHS